MSITHKPYLSPSTAKKLLDFPLPIAYHQIHKPFEPSPAMQFGSLVDCLLTTPLLFDSEYRVLEGKQADGRTKEGKQAKADAKADGVEVVNIGKLAEAKKAVLNVMTHPVYQGLKNIKTQVKVEGEVNGIQTLGFADIVADDVILDLKVFTQTVFENRASTIYNRHLHLQLYIYQQVINPDARVGLLVCSSEAPYHVEVWWMNEEWMDMAEAEHHKAIKAYKEYLLYDPEHSVTGDEMTVFPKPWMS